MVNSHTKRMCWVHVCVIMCWKSVSSGKKEREREGERELGRRKGREEGTREGKEGRKEESPDFVAFADFPDLNSPTMANFKLKPDMTKPPNRDLGRHACS